MGVIKRMADVVDAKPQQTPKRCDGCYRVSFDETEIVPIRKEGIDLMVCVDYVSCVKQAKSKKIGNYQVVE